MKDSSFIRTWRHLLSQLQRLSQCLRFTSFALVSDTVTEKVCSMITSRKLGSKLHLNLPSLVRVITSSQLSTSETCLESPRKLLMTKLPKSTFSVLTEPKNQLKRELFPQSQMELELVSLKISRKMKSRTVSFGKTSFRSISR